jgi:hypothetical protein
MAYTPLTIPTQTPPSVRSLIQSIEDHFFRDVHTMLRLPQADHDMPAGCNFAITQALTAAISGVSVTLYSYGGGTGARFKGLVTHYYPWKLEPVVIGPDVGAQTIYNVFRNPLTHDLGLDLQRKRKTKRVNIKRLGHSSTTGLSESTVEAIETNIRKVTPSPTLAITPDATTLLVEVFYWGVRTMIENISKDTDRMQAAEAFLTHRLRQPLKRH